MTPEEFWTKAHKSKDCWLWKGQLNHEKYGVASVTGFKTTAAHRIAYMLDREQHILPSLPICHKCDNPQCVRPSHLHVGSSSDNGRDRTRQSKPDAKQLIYLLNAPLRWGLLPGHDGELALHRAHISSDDTFALCGGPLVFVMLMPGDTVRRGLVQKIVCTSCLAVSHHYYPNGYDFIRRTPRYTS